jgi:hypothetical protein
VFKTQVCRYYVIVNPWYRAYLLTIFISAGQFRSQAQRQACICPYCIWYISKGHEGGTLSIKTQ